MGLLKSVVWHFDLPFLPSQDLDFTAPSGFTTVAEGILSKDMYYSNRLGAEPLVRSAGLYRIPERTGEPRPGKIWGGRVDGPRSVGIGNRRLVG